MASGANLLACGENVFLPPVNPGEVDRSKYSPRNSDPGPSALFPTRKPVARHDLLNSQLGDLSKVLVFSDDAITALGSNMQSYASGSGKLMQGNRDLFSYRSMPGFREKSRKKLAAPSGRHDSRGQGGRHLPCHLMQPRDLERTVKNPSDNITRNDITPQKERARKKTRVVFKDAISLTGELPSDKSYTKQLEAGAKPLHVQGRDSIICLDNNTMFKKTLQDSYPQPPVKYCKDGEKPSSLDRRLVHFQGHKRWLDVPKPVEPSAELPWECCSIDSSSQWSSSEELTQQSSVTFEEPEKHEFFSIMREWSTQWKLHISLNDLNEVCDDGFLVQDMKSVCDNTRMYAIAAVSLLAENQALLPSRRGSRTALGFNKTPAPSVERMVSTELVNELQRLLDDSSPHVRVPAAITLYSMDKQTEKAEKVLHAALAAKGMRGCERWAAVQCLVCAGCVSADIIAELLHHLMDSLTPARQERAAQLLATASYKTNLVHSMVADQLNNSGWQERYAACSVLPLLHNTINKDMCTKLLELAWGDWSREVQFAAAKALGRTSHGKLIHDDIATRLTDESVLLRMDAIRKLHSLQLMTSKLLPTYLTCFNDEHLSMRMEAVALSGSLKLRHPKVMKSLKQQLLDNSWMLKSCALRALAEIGDCDAELEEMLTWAVRFEKMPAVRGEACRTIARLRLREEKVTQALKNAVTLDEDVAVVRQAKHTLGELGHSDQVTDEMVQGVCDTVKRLGTKEAIASELFAAEANSITSYGLRRPTHQLTVRDYLNHKQRSIAYGSDEVESRTQARTSARTSRSVWTPDRETIDTQLGKIRRRVRSSL